MEIKEIVTWVRAQLAAIYRSLLFAAWAFKQTLTKVFSFLKAITMYIEKAVGALARRVPQLISFVSGTVKGFLRK